MKIDITEAELDLIIEALKLVAWSHRHDRNSVLQRLLKTKELLAPTLKWESAGKPNKCS